MQISLNKLALYCQKWKIQINTSKSKIMIASKRKCTLVHNFTISNEVIEIVDKYKYLGLLITHNGQLKTAQEHLANRAIKAWFSIKNGLYNEKVWPINIYLKSFDTVIKPIVLYGCEIWGENMINKKDCNAFAMPKFDVSLPCEQLHVKICKQILRVPRKATNIAVLAELGRRPLYYDIMINLTKYYLRLQSLSNNGLLQKVFTQSKTIDNNTVEIMKYVANEVGCNMELVNFCNKSVMKRSVKQMKNKLSKYFENCFFTYMQEENNKKLCTYKHFKPDYCMEPYLYCITDPIVRKEVTCLRISAHTLNIERGRYKNINRDKRICSVCNSGEIENEFHFMMDCAFYLDLRQKYLYPLLSMLKMNDWDGFVNIIRSDNEQVILNVANYISEAMKRRKNSKVKSI